jgi:membrane protease YdiL (CAAX protease family)
MISTTRTLKLQATVKLSRVWLVLLSGPVLFLLGIIVASIYFGFVTQGDVAAIPDLVAASTPYQLVVIQILLFFILRWAMKRDGLTWEGIGWKKAEGQRTWSELLIGGLPGVVLGLLYVFFLAPWLTRVQQSLGDYVPAGEIMTTLGAAVLPFFIANVVLAPFVEENIYRGYALTRLFGRFSQPVAILISCAFFGLLHWAGGFWYTLLTGIVAGGTFAALFTARRNMLAPFAAHLALNIVEFLFIGLAM